MGVEQAVLEEGFGSEGQFQGVAEQERYGDVPTAVGQPADAGCGR